MKTIIQIDNKILIIFDYIGDNIESHYDTIRTMLAKNTLSATYGDLYEYDEEYVNNQKYVGGWAFVNVQDDMQNISYDELRSNFIEQMEVSHLALDMLDFMQEMDEDKARKFMIDKFNNEFFEKEIANFLYKID